MRSKATCAALTPVPLGGGKLTGPRAYREKPTWSVLACLLPGGTPAPWDLQSEASGFLPRPIANWPTGPSTWNSIPVIFANRSILVVPIAHPPSPISVTIMQSVCINPPTSFRSSRSALDRTMQVGHGLPCPAFASSFRGIDDRHRASVALCSTAQILPARALFFCRQWLGRTHLRDRLVSAPRIHHWLDCHPPFGAAGGFFWRGVPPQASS